MAEIADVLATEQEPVTITLSATDGFRYLDFEPPIDFERISACTWPVMDIADGRSGVWYPTSIDTDKVTGRIARIGFFSDSFEGEVQTQTSYAELVAAHIGNAVVKV